MRHIRSKITLALILIALLPIIPLYIVVEYLLERGLALGLNVEVEQALEGSLRFSKAQYNRFRDETFEIAKRISNDATLKGLDIAEEPFQFKLSDSFPDTLDIFLEVFDSAGRRVLAEPDSMKQYSTDGKLLRAMIGPRTAALLDHEHQQRRVKVIAPIMSEGEEVGSLVVTRILPAQFVEDSQQILDVFQMMKALALVRSGVRTSFIRTFLAIYLGMLLLSIGLGYFLSKRITAPLNKLVEGTEIVARGDMNHRVRVMTRDEIGKLGQSFNEMIRNLKQQQEQILYLERMTTWKEIARTLAHEIKNPLTPIQLMVQELKDKYKGDDPAYGDLLGKCAEIILDEVEKLRNLTREFSDFARLPELHRSQGDLNELLSELVRLYPNKPISLDLSPNLKSFSFDVDKIRRVLINLIDNAIHAVRNGGSITLSADISTHEVLLSVSDTGIGMEPEHLKKIFEPHFSTKHRGMGLGLAISKGIVEQHGGRISVQSQLGAGTRFTITLPYEQ